MEPKLKLGKAGVSDGFLKELDQALAREELVKIRVGKLVEADLADLAKKTKAELVAELGRTALLYRPGKPPEIELPDE